MDEVLGAGGANSPSHNSNSTSFSKAAAGSVDVEDQRKFVQWSERLMLAADDLRIFLKAGFCYEDIPRVDSVRRRQLLRYLKQSRHFPAKWLLICGLFPEIQYSEADRREQLRPLYRAVQIYIRRALARFCEDPFKDERSIYWDPTAEVCRELEIAPSKLSALCKEFSGHSLSQVIDCVRAERFKKELRGRVREFLNKRTTHGATLAADSDRWVIWKELRASRRWPEFCPNTWAQGFGFSTYRRLYRACLAVWKMTPHQLEMVLIGEIIQKNESDDRFIEVDLRMLDVQVREVYLFGEKEEALEAAG